MFQLFLTDIFVEVYSYYIFQQNKHQQQSLPFNRIYKSKAMSHMLSPWTMWIVTCSSGRKKYKALTFWCFMFQLQTNMFWFSIHIMLLYILSLKGKDRIGIKRIQVILRGRYLVKRSGNVRKYKNQWHFVIILFGQGNKFHSCSYILKLLNGLCCFEESLHTARRLQKQ